MQLRLLHTQTKGLHGLRYTRAEIGLGNGHSSDLHIIKYDQYLPHLKLLLSKASEALNPDQPGNHIGEGGTFDELTASQPDLCFLINGTYNHYRKDYYPWNHDDYQIGDPVGFTRIRHHVYNDIAYDTANGYCQSETGAIWTIAEQPDLDGKYLLSSRPMLIWAHKPQVIPDEIVPPGAVNPPGFLGHSHERHARTAVGEDRAGNLTFLVVDCAGDSVGATLPELQQAGLSLNMTNLLNLDGGGSSRFWLHGENGDAIQNKVTEEDADRVLGHTFMMVDTRTCARSIST